MGPSISGLVSSLKTASVHMPYSSDVEGKTTRVLYLTAWRTTRRFSSKSSSNTRSGSST
jgi:hypothetical protein